MPETKISHQKPAAIFQDRGWLIIRLAKLGEGGMGIVWRARHSRLGRLVAIKVLTAGGLADPERKRRFFQEARAVSNPSQHHHHLRYC